MNLTHLHDNVGDQVKHGNEEDLIKQSENLTIKTPQEYLNAITTSIDCAEDLGLYKIDRAISNEKISLVGIQILSESL